MGEKCLKQEKTVCAEFYALRLMLSEPKINLAKPRSQKDRREMAGNGGK
jgi:hypothetical protein